MHFYFVSQYILGINDAHSVGNRKLFKNGEIRFLFHLKSNFHSQIFVLTFWSGRKTD